MFALILHTPSMQQVHSMPGRDLRESDREARYIVFFICEEHLELYVDLEYVTFCSASPTGSWLYFRQPWPWDLQKVQNVGLFERNQFRLFKTEKIVTLPIPYYNCSSCFLMGCIFCRKYVKTLLLIALLKQRKRTLLAKDLSSSYNSLFLTI